MPSQPDPTTAPVGTDRSSAEILRLPNDEAGHGHCEPFHHQFFQVGTLRSGETVVNLRPVAAAFASLDGRSSDISRERDAGRPAQMACLAEPLWRSQSTVEEA